VISLYRDPVKRLRREPYHEYRSMADGLADPDAPSTGVVRLWEWAREHRGSLGRRYMNELDLHFIRQRRADRA